jgi:hypothetical protein
VRRALEVLATLERVRVLDGTQVIAAHPRSFDRRQQIGEPAPHQPLMSRARILNAVDLLLVNKKHVLSKGSFCITSRVRAANPLRRMSIGVRCR